MRLFEPPPSALRGVRPLAAALTGLALAASAQAAAPTPPADPVAAAAATAVAANPDAVVVSNAPLKLAPKHREVKPGPVKPQAWPSKPLPLLGTPSPTRSPS